MIYTALKIIFVPMMALVIALGWIIDIFMLRLKDMNTCKECGESGDRFWFYVCSPLLIISMIGMGLARLMERMGY